MTDKNALAYRPDIDGLRAIAVLSVVLYHFGMPGIGGGFVGVDVFFVISGFLIGGLLWREVTTTGRLRLAAFFARRIKRLMPAFFVMATTCAAVGYFFVLPFEYRAFGKSLIAATVYLSNLLFYTEAGYFDTGAEDKLLLHTWSLAVEEQFYIIIPLLILLLSRWLGVLRAVLWTLAIASLAASIWITPQNQPAAFYLFPFRAWEMLAGVLLAIEAQRRTYSFQAPALLSFAGLALIVFAILRAPAGLEFPGIWALAPVLGTILLIVAGRGRNLVNTVLRTPEATSIGLISYSLYLWHWPVHVLSTYIRGDNMPFHEIVGWIAVSLILAWVSWRFVETPIRRRNRPLWRTYLAALIASGILLAAAGTIFSKDGIPNRFSAPLRTHIDASADFLQDWSRCYDAQTPPFIGLQICPIGPEAAEQDISVLIWGDSHVRALKEGLEQAAYETNTPALLIWRAGCAPIFGLSKDETAATGPQNTACTEANTQLETALKERPFARILLVGRWPYYANGAGTGLDAHNQITLSVAGQTGTQAEQLAQGLLATVQTLQDTGAKMTVLEPIPEIANYTAPQIARALAGRRMDQGALTKATTLPREALTPRREAISEVWDSLDTIDLTEDLCDAATCHAIHDGVGQYFDNNHLTNSAAIRLRGAFKPFLEGAQE